jgi:O-antigen biosynthesis protein WbqP
MSIITKKGLRIEINKRVFDLLVCVILACLLFLPMVIIAIMIFSTSKGPVLFWSDRIGINNEVFKMPKFRTMLINTPVVATHLIKNSDELLSPIGGFLRRFSLDEFPQLFSILKGDMSFVGPRPALYNQFDLIEMRKNKGIHNLKPGLTGWAQINGRDNISLSNKVDLDFEYLQHKSFIFDLKIIKLTILKVIMKEDVSH